VGRPDWATISHPQRLKEGESTMLRTQRSGEETRVNRLLALKKRHEEINDKIEHARTHMSISDFYLNELKKQKLHLKDLIEQMVRGGHQDEARTA
jgi:hypothetical protein